VTKRHDEMPPAPKSKPSPGFVGLPPPNPGYQYSPPTRVLIPDPRRPGRMIECVEIDGGALSEMAFLHETMALPRKPGEPQGRK
jgi:hypothetical protein